MDHSIKAILIDFDGTLVDSERLHYQCWCDAVQSYGAKITWDDYRQRLVGTDDRKAGRILLAEAGVKPTDQLVATVVGRKKSLYGKQFCVELQIAPEVISLLRRCAQELPLGLVSSSLTSEVEPLLIQCGIRSAFRFIVCGDDVTRVKPHPEPYLRALTLLNQSGEAIPPANCLVFEDSASGVTSARTAGMMVHAVASPHEFTFALSEHLARRAGAA